MNAELRFGDSSKSSGHGIMPDAAPGKPLKLLFVCTKNTCRSPMAEAYVNSFGPAAGIFACSAGLCVSSERPISKGAVFALRSEGIISNEFNPYEAHRSRQISAGMAEEFDRIIGVTENHAALIARSFPEAAGKTVALPGVTIDPYGSVPEVYAACLKQIISGIRALFPFIEK